MGASEPIEEALGGRVMVGGFRLERALGDAADGRFAAVGPDGKRVTLELMGSDPAPLVEGLRELRRLALRDAAHVFPVLEVGLDEATGRAFVVLPGFEGTDVRRLIADGGPIHPAAAAGIVIQACRALQALYGTSAVLREILPSDLFLIGGESGVTVRVAPLSALRSRAGTSAGFSPPELSSDETEADARSNVWSLATCLYWMLSGSLPGPDVGAPHAVANVQDRAPWVAPGLATALHLALASDPKARWPSLEALAGALAPFADGKLAQGALAPLDAKARARVAERANLAALELPAPDPSTSVTSTASSTGLFKKLQHEPAGLAALIGRKLGGRWQVLRVIGRGGMGAVFEVSGPDGARAAAKLIDRKEIGEDEETYKRFVREAQAASDIHSAHVVRTIEAGLDQELKVPYIIMELLSGVDLRTVLKDQGALQAPGVVRLFIQAARGLAEAHRQRIVHRDIKPANLFLHAPDGDRITVKICDFGIAKRTSEVDGEQSASHELTRTGGMLGSPLYMSPEQATNARKVDHRTDIWSLCISLYEALSGSKPWAGRSALGEIIVAICTQRVPSLHRVAPWVDRGLAEAVHRGLVAEIAERYPTVEALVEALEPFAGDADDLRVADLVAVTPEQRALEPSSLPPPPADHGAATVMGGAMSVRSADSAALVGREPERSRVRTWVLIGAAASLAVVALTWASQRRPPAQGVAPAGDTPTETPSAVTPPPEPTRARLEIIPPGASVTVEGRPVEVVGGAIELRGLPGTRFEVIASLEDGKKQSRVSVVLSRDGTAIPNQVVVATEEEPSKKRPPRVIKPGTAAREPQKEPVSEPATSTAKPPSEPRQPEFKNEW